MRWRRADRQTHAELSRERLDYTAPMTTLILLAALGVAQQPGEARARDWAACLGPVPADAVAACTRLINAGGLSTSEEARLYESRGVARGRIGAFADAIADLTRAIELDADRGSAHYMRAGVYIQTRQFDKAVADLRRAEKIEPDNPSHPRGLAGVLGTMGDLKGAVAAADRAIELVPDWAPAYAQRGLVKGRLRDYKGALEDLDRAIQMDPRQASFLVDRGEVKSDAGDYFGATQDFERAMALAPTNIVAVADRGLVRMRMRNYAGAVEDFEKALATNPRNYTAVGSLIASLMEARAAMGDVDGALNECRSERLKSLPPTAPLHRACGTQFGRAGRMPEALAMFAAAIELEPRNAATYHSRAILKSDRQDHAGALADLRTAIGLDASRDYTQLRLWLIEARLGNRAAATAALREAITRRTADNADPWVMTLAGYLAGTVGEAALMKAADEGPAVRTSDRRCEAYFYSGWMHLVDGDTAGARSRLEQSVATGAATMVEFHSAKAELEFLRKE